MFIFGKRWRPSLALLAAITGLLITLFQIGIEFFDQSFFGADKAFKTVKVNNVQILNYDKINFYVPDNSDILSIHVEPTEDWNIVSTGYREYIPNNIEDVPFKDFSLFNNIYNGHYGTTFSIVMRKGETGKEHIFYINVRKYNTLTVDFSKLIDNQSKIIIPIKNESGEFHNWVLTYINKDENDYSVFDSPDKLAKCLHDYIGLDSPYGSYFDEVPFYEYENEIFTYKGCVSDDTGEIIIEY